MKMAVKTCCFCGTLRSGSLIVGYLDILAQLVLLLCQIVVATKPYSHDSLPLPSYTIIGTCIGITVTVILIIGVIKGRASLLLPWLTCMGVAVIGAVIYFIILGTTFSPHPEDDYLYHNTYNPYGSYGSYHSYELYHNNKAVIWISLLVTWALHIYFIVVVYSHYRELQSQQPKTSPLSAVSSQLREKDESP